ncbi:uncharacterized protein LOC105771495 [Gossypium raimondii]|uniref:uncharacterized protein LOC105771495 n=1 Tax=Gossypium raimondii TaxID=29730 RepID=UPI00063AEE0D|nr:uncharacterized protein LOC105771495 [Gossypium raimondii]
METPLSSRRVTRSQTLAASNNGIPVSKVKTKGSEKSASKARIRNGKQQQQEERSALIGITNDSPIVGVVMKTPSSAVVVKGKTNMMTMMTPGFGEALRGQVKTLLQKVEEEAEVSKVPL